MSTLHLPPIDPNNSQSIGDYTLFKTKMAKKQAETEAQKIQGRIQLLQMEQLKLSKKNQQTEQKVYEIYTSKKMQQQKKQEKLRYIQSLPQPFSHQIAVQQRENMKRIILTTLEQRHQEAQQIRVSHKSNFIASNRAKEEDIALLKNKAQQIKKEEEESNHIIKSKLNMKRQQVRSQVQFEMQAINEEKLEQDRMIKMLEAEEMEVLNKLQQTQNHSRHIQQKFKMAQQLTPQEFDEKFAGLNQSQSMKNVNSTYGTSIIEQQDELK